MAPDNQWKRIPFLPTRKCQSIGHQELLCFPKGGVNESIVAKKAKFAKEGLIIKGTASYVGKDSYAYPAGIVIDEVATP